MALIIGLSIGALSAAVLAWMWYRVSNVKIERRVCGDDESGGKAEH